MIDLPIMRNHQSPPLSPPPDSIFKRDALAVDLLRLPHRRKLNRTLDFERDARASRGVIIAETDEKLQNRDRIHGQDPLRCFRPHCPVFIALKRYTRACAKTPPQSQGNRLKDL